ncbi:hypothetical protein ACP3V3_01975 [Vibrio sp. PNB22_3_1]
MTRVIFMLAVLLSIMSLPVRSSAQRAELYVDPSSCGLECREFLRGHIYRFDGDVLELHYLNAYEWQFEQFLGSLGLAREDLERVRSLMVPVSDLNPIYEHLGRLPLMVSYVD